MLSIYDFVYGIKAEWQAIEMAKYLECKFNTTLDIRFLLTFHSHLGFPVKLKFLSASHIEYLNQFTIWLRIILSIWLWPVQNLSWDCDAIEVK